MKYFINNKEFVQCPKCKKNFEKREKNITYHDTLNYCDDCAEKELLDFLNSLHEEEVLRKSLLRDIIIDTNF